VSTPRLLLVSPAFHGYWRAIQGALERRGYAVTTHLYDVRTPLARARHKLTREVLPRLGATDRGASDGDAAVAAIRMTDPHVLLVVKGDTLGEVFWDRAQQVPRRALWLYDEIRRTRHTTASLAAAGASSGPLANLGGRSEVVVSSGQGRAVTLVITVKNTVGANTGPMTLTLDGPMASGKQVAGKYQLFLPTP